MEKFALFEATPENDNFSELLEKKIKKFQQNFGGPKKNFESQNCPNFKSYY